MTADRRQFTVMTNEKIYTFLSLGLTVWESSTGLWRKESFPQFFLEDFFKTAVWKVDEKVEGKY